MKTMLIIGGTGILGSALSERACAQGYSVTCLANQEPSILPITGSFIYADKQSLDFQRQIRDSSKTWDVIVDILSYDEPDAHFIYDAVRGQRSHLFVMSTALVYDRFVRPYDYSPIVSNHPLAQIGTHGGYVDGKLRVEHFWQGKQDIPFTILRPYHVLGRGSQLGCIPPHNRDPELIGKIDAEDILLLSDGGRVLLNIVHPQDIAETILRCAGKKTTFGRSYNVVNPAIICARAYFEEIARQRGKKLRVHAMPSEQLAWYFRKTWQLSTLPNLYDTSDLYQDTGFVPSISLEKCIHDALTTLPSKRLFRSELSVHAHMNKHPAPLVHPSFRDAYYAALL